MNSNAASVSPPPVNHDGKSYQARGIHSEWDDEQVGRLKGVGAVPHFSTTPQKIWRGSVPVGADNDEIYGNLLGRDTASLTRLREQRTI